MGNGEVGTRPGRWRQFGPLAESVMVSDRLGAIACFVVLLLGACTTEEQSGQSPSPPRRPPLVVVGVDGGSWTVIERLWQEGRLPALRELADSGSRAVLGTRYTASPVIWTSIATGVEPAVHGITGFVVAREGGDVPVSSTLRRVPALWTMATAAGRRSAVLGWWASWPAEPIDGLVVSDRAVHPDLAARVSPASFAPRVDELLGDLDPRLGLGARRDELVLELLPEILEQELDLVLAYFRDPDIQSHHTWRYFDPQSFPDLAPVAQEDPRREAIAVAYERVDRAVSTIRRHRPEANVLVVSDHGFVPGSREEMRISLDFDGVLERLGLLERAPDGAVDIGRSELLTHATEITKPLKLVRFGGRAAPDQGAVRARAERALGECRWSDGAPAFWVRDRRGAAERRAGADFAVLVVEPRGVGRQAATTSLICGDLDLTDAIRGVSFISGVHTEHTHGILIAAGPELAIGAPLEGIDILDLAPTILYGLGLPVAADFAGVPRTDLFRDAVTASRPVRSIATWNRAASPPAPAATASAADQQLVDELRSLGYVD